MKLNINLTVKNKLFLGFGGILLIMIAISINTFVGLQEIETTEDRLLNLRFPTVLAGAELENGINLSLAGLRGYMILGKDPKKAMAMKETRLAGWAKIDNAINQMKEFSLVYQSPVVCRHTTWPTPH